MYTRSIMPCYLTINFVALHPAAALMSSEGLSKDVIQVEHDEDDTDLHHCRILNAIYR